MKKANSWNRLLSLVLCICMVLSLMPAVPLPVKAVDVLTENTDTGTECSHATVDSATAKCSDCGHQYAVSVLDEESSDLGDYLPPGTEAGPSISYYDALADVVAAYGTDNNYVPEGDGYTEDVDVESALTGPYTVTIYGAVEVGAGCDWSFKSNKSFVIQQGASLTVNGAFTLNGALTNNGTILLNGTGTIVNNGTGTCGEDVKHLYQVGICLVCKSVCTHTGGSATCTELAVCADCGLSYGDYVDHVFDAETGLCVCGAGKPYEGVSVSGVQVDAANAADVLGDGTVSYDAATNTLTIRDNENIGAVTVTGGTLAVYGDVVLYGDLTASSVELYDGATLVWGDGITVWIDTLSGTGTVINDGARYYDFSNQGVEIVKHTHTKGVAVCGSRRICPDCGRFYGEVVEHVYDENGACVRCERDNAWVVTYTSSNDWENMTASPTATPEFFPNYVRKGEDLVLEAIGAEDGYTLTLRVYVDDVEVYDFTLVKDVLTVPADVITGEVRIEAYADMMDDDVCVYYGVPVFTWAEDYSSASAVMYCADHWCEVTGECTVTTRTVQPTCAADGYLEYAATVTLDLNGIDKTYTDVKTVTLPRLEVHQTANQNSKCPVCGTTLYNIYLGGLQVTERNAADILGDGTVSYDAATGTLTLNGATVDMTETNLAIHDDTQQEQKDRIKNGETFEPYFNPLTPALQITGGELTLVLQGENTLIGLAEILGSEIFEGLIYGVPAVSIADGASLTVTGDDTATLTLLSDDIGYTELDHIPNASSISGGSLTVAGGTVTTFNGIRLTGDYTQTGGSLETGFLEAQNVTVSDGSLNAQGYSGIYPRYFDSNAGGIHGIFANTAINISGGTVTSASGVVGHNGDYSSMNKVDGETVTTHGLYALGSVTVTGGTVTSTGCEDGYYIDEVGFLTKGSYDMVTGSYVVTDEGAPAGSALEAPTWSISEEATFICGSETSHRGGTATCNTLAVCHFCGEAYGETDSANHDTVNAQYTNGFCDGCDIYEAPEAVDGVYQIGNAGELYWFAQQVNGGKRNIKAVLTDDITINENVLVDGQLNPDTTLVSGFRNWTPIGNKTNYYYGSFDGQNHSISGLYYQGGDTYVGLFGYLTYDAAVKNLTLTDSYFDVDASGTSPFYAGGIAGMLMVGSIENCHNEATLCVNYDYNANVGGVAGFVAANGTVSHCSNAGELHGINTQISYMGGIVGNAAGTITNCGNTGDITVDNGVNTVASGVANGGTLKNCFSTGSINVTSEVSYLGGISGSSATATNCYYLEGTADGGIGGEDSEGAAQAMSQEAFASGEVAYLLNGGVTDGTQSWYQTLGTDAYPGFTGGTVYYGYEACYDTDTDYSNDVRYVTIPSHNYSDNGFCVVCDAPQGAQTNDQGIYEIGNAGQLVWFSMYVNAGNYGKSAVLTADIDMEGVEGFAPMCSTGLYNNADPAADGDWGYTGTFDGQGYEISNLSLTGSATETLSYGLFGTVSGTVKNLGMKNFSFVDGGKDCRAGSIVGQLLGGTITDCYAVDCTLDVTEGTTGYIAGGIAGCNYGGTIQNSFVMNCTVKGHSRCAALVADCRGDASTSDRPGTVKNCYSDTTLAGSQKVASYIIDCENYVLSTRFSSGELALLLGDAWGQTIGTDEHPVVGGPAVYKNTCGDGFFYANDETDYDEHTMDGIICSVCGNYQAAVLITEENYASLGADASHVGAYGISNVSQLYWYAALTNGMLTGVPMDYYASGVLLADLDLEGRGWIPIGLYEETIDGMYLSTCWGSDNVWDDVNQRYTTYFDGMGHTISNFNAVGENSQGLFGYIYCASIMNLTVKNATASGWNAGVIAGYPYGCVIDNCSVIGCTISGETATADSTFSVVGAMTGSFYGYIYNSCAYDCTVLRARDEDYLYALGGLEDDGYVYNSAYSKVRYGYVGDESLSDFTYGWYMSEEDMASGYVAYWLSQGYSDENYTVSGDIWGQTIGTDAYPVLGGPAVYQVLDCDGVTTAYSNTNENKSHSYNEYGWCTVCEAECVHTPDETTGNCAVCGNFIIAKGVVAVQCQEGEESEAGYEEGYRSGIRYFVNINEALSWGYSELYLYGNAHYSGEFTLNDTTHMVDPQVKLYLNSHTLTMAEDLGVYLGYDLEIIDGTVTGSYDGALLRPYIGTYELTLNGVTLVNEQGYALSNGNEDGGSWKLTLLGGSSLKGAVADVYYSSTEQSGLVFGDSYIGEPIRFALAPEITAENFVLATAAEGVTVDRSWIADNDTTDELYVLRDAENNQLYLGACVEATHEWDWVQLETTHERTCAICSLYESTDHADEIADHLCDTCGKKVSDHDVQEEISWYLSEDGCYANLYVSCPGCDITVYDSGDATLTGSYEGTSCQDPSTVTYSFTYTYDGTEYTVTETLKTGTDPHIGFDSEGFCTACGGYQKPTVDPGEDPEWDYDDVYLIYNAGQLYWFANHVNNVNNGITGKLMANIDLNPGYTFNADGSYSFNGIEGPFAGGIAGLEPPRMWTPIGSGSPCYAGNFDGNGFTVSGVYALSEGRYVGFFGNTDYNYNITNLGITNSYFEGADHVGGLIGYAYTVVKNCYVTDTVYVSGSYATAALIGYNGGEVSNCYAMADTLVDNNYGSCYNCYYLADEDTDDNDGTTALTAEDFTSGKAAYLLQSGILGEEIYDEETGSYITLDPEQIWGQTIGEDAYPILGGEKVYQTTNCLGEILGYSNTDLGVIHDYVNGFCDAKEGEPHYQPAVLNGDVYEISNAGQLYWFAEKVNNGEAAINGKLIDNIVVNENVLNADGNPNGSNFRQWTTIGNNTMAYTGTFDGNSMTVSGLYYDSWDVYVGLFSYVGEGGTVRNLGVVDSYLRNNGSSIIVGGVVGFNVGTVTNCYNSGTIDGYGAGGVVGQSWGTVDSCFNMGRVVGEYAAGGVTSYSTGTVTNCYNTGAVSGEDYVGGVVGYNNAGTVTGSYNTGAVIGYGYVGGVAGRNKGGTVTNCYFDSAKFDGDAVGENTGTVTNAEGKTEEQFTSGEVAYLLQGNQETHVWGQTIGEDVYPILGGEKVYQVTYCLGSITYSNTDGDGHTWNDATCTEPKTCGTCGVTEGEALGHSWNDATCTEPKTCDTCGATEGEALGHSWNDATCTEPKTCGSCGITEGEALGHSWNDATCTAPKTCGTCGVTEGEALGHSWNDATCTEPKTCGTCGETEGEALGHSWNDATCTEPKTCGSCGETEGEALGHSWNDATCTKPKTCSVCNATEGNALGHNWIQICTKPETCSVCGATRGHERPHIVYEYDGVCDYCGAVAVLIKLEETGTEYYAFVEAGEDLVISVPESEHNLRCWVEDTLTGEGLTAGLVNQDGTFTVSGAYLDGSRAVCVEVIPVYVGTINLNGGSITDDGKKTLESAGLKCMETYHEFVYYIRYSSINLYTSYYIREGYTLVGYELDGVVYDITDYYTVSGDNYVIDLIWEANSPINLDSASLSFKEKIHYNIFFSLGIDETVDLSNMGLIMFDSLNADGTMDDAIAIYSGAVEMDGKYRVATDGVPAKRMGDTIYFRAYAKLADGSYVYSKTVEYSAVTYAEHILVGDESESAKALVVAMLNYGAAAQLFFGYNTDNLVNAFLTDEQKALPEQYRDDMVNTVPVVAAEKQGIFANNKGFSRRMPAVSFEGAFEINYFFTPAYTPVDGITLYYWTEADFDANEVLTVDNATGSLKMEGTGTEQYRGDIGGIAAKNLSENIYVAAVYSDGTTTWTSGVLGYSIGAYCGRLATNGGAIADLAMATAVYGYHAKQFFGS